MQRSLYTLIAALCLGAFGASAQQVTPAIPSYDALTLPGGKTAGRAFVAGLGTVLTSVALGAANRLYAEPLWVGNVPSLAKTLSFNISVGNASAWNARMCLYQDSGAGLPGGLIPGADTGVIAIGSGSVTGVQTSSTLNSGNGVVVSGWIWVAFVADTTGESLSSIGNDPMHANQLLGSTLANIYAINYTQGVFGSLTFGACPATFPATSYLTAAAAPAIAVGF